MNSRDDKELTAQSIRSHKSARVSDAPSGRAGARSFEVPYTNTADLRHVLCAANALLVTTVWLYLISSGFTATGIVDGVYELQAQALAAGRLHIEPGPLRIFFHDALMYWGEYYFYWGLLPSGIFLGLNALFGEICAHYLTVFPFLFCLVFFFQKIIFLIIESVSDADRQAFTDSQATSSKHAEGAYSTRSLMAWLSGAALTWVVLFIIPYPLEQGWFFGRFVVYEQQIIFGLGVAMPGIYLIAKGWQQKSVSHIALATLIFCVAAWTRVTWFPLAVVMIPTTIFLIQRQKDRESEYSRTILFTVIAVCIGLLVSLTLINYIRFGSFLDFGVRYQNPAHYAYFRNLKMFFSPETRLWNCLFNLLSYYVSPDMVEHLGVLARSFAYREGMPPSFFSFNPQFLLLIVVLPLGLYRMYKAGGSLYIPFLTLVGTALYLHLIVTFFGTFVILRYFVEFYYFNALVFFCILLMFLRPVWAFPVFVLLIAAYIPGTVHAFFTIQPELRTVNPKISSVTTPTVRSMTPFIEPRVSWPLGALTAGNLPRLQPYAVMGIARGGQGNLLGQDICAVYLVPMENLKIMDSPRITIRGVSSLRDPGKLQIFFEDRLVASHELDPTRATDISVKLPFSIEHRAPYQVMLVFLSDNTAYLPGRTSGQPQFFFQQISFATPPIREDASSRVRLSKDLPGTIEIINHAYAGR